VKSDAAKAAFAQGVQKWVTTKVARHKFLRGGVIVIDAVPKRWDALLFPLPLAADRPFYCSAAGKILRRELRDLAKKELAGRDPADNLVKAKL
jgi:hypothetical protein